MAFSYANVNYSLRSFLVLPSTPTYVDGLFQASTCVTHSRIRTVLLLQSDSRLKAKEAYLKELRQQLFSKKKPSA